ncbi:DUF6344 domain-containing protein [Streptomyces lichenis]|uniref:DUF6344 domain-containing protein n=1 Tax=Streptomyces lichenis TaxID=2306967 RepID=A0ABT0I4K5_9ACTN|nr:DUF6344 domain-containing protein [Streptomyces lichenis]MCK8676258.1 DUF6344 domain-containing protein [Streptomyces lichenis]
MAATTKAAQFWTAFLTLLSAILSPVLSAVGLTRRSAITGGAVTTGAPTAPATAEAAVAEPRPEGGTTAPPRGADRRADALTPVDMRLGRTASGSASTSCVPSASAGSPGTRDRSLPPTIKQRIRAEAHGSSPSVRHLPAVAPLPAGMDLADLALAA